MAAGDVRRVTRGMLFVQRHVAEQGRSAIRPLDQVVAENRVVGKVAAALFEGIQIVDPFADERAFGKQILVHIRYDTGVRIDARIVRVQLGETRAVGTGQVDADPRLQDRIAIDDPAAVRIEDRPIERMGQRAHQLPRGVARQVRVGIERDDITHAGQDRGLADHLRETALRAAERRIQIGQLAAFALVTHPHTLLGVPAA